MNGERKLTQKKQITVKGTLSYSNPATTMKNRSKCRIYVLVRVLGSTETPNDPFSESQCTLEPQKISLEPLKLKVRQENGFFWHMWHLESDVH